MVAILMLPNFVIAGAAKAGTTALGDALAQHPDVFLAAKKEPHYFLCFEQPLRFSDKGAEWLNRNMISSRAKYERLFVDAGEHLAVGESSVYYLCHPETHVRIARTLGQRARIIVSLRHPVDRAFSAFSHLVRDGRAKPAHFLEIWAEEERYAHAGWDPIWQFRRLSTYADDVRSLFSAFGRDRVHLIRYEDFVGNPRRAIGGAYRFLGVKDSFEPALNRRLNVSGAPRSALLQRSLTGQWAGKQILRRAVPAPVRRTLYRALQQRNVDRLSLDPATRELLTREFESDIRELTNLTGIPFDEWLLAHRPANCDD